jgi:hypothetical protein
MLKKKLMKELKKFKIVPSSYTAVVHVKCLTLYRIRGSKAEVINSSEFFSTTLLS